MTGQGALWSNVRAVITMWVIGACAVTTVQAVRWWPGRNRNGVSALLGDLPPWVAGVLALAAGVQLLRWCLEVRRQAREAVRARIAARVVAVVGHADSGTLVRIRRWKGRTTASRIVIRPPKAWDWAHETARRDLAKALADATEQTWVAHYGRFSRVVTFTVRSERPSSSARRAVAEERIDRMVRSSIPGASSVAVQAWTDAAEPTKIVATYRPSPRISSPRIQDAITAAVAATLPGRWVAEWDTVKDRVTFTVRPGLPEMALRPRGLAAPTAGVQLRYAVREDGSLQVWDLGGSAPHGLFVGATGGGKTTCLRAIALDAISQGVQVDGCDPKRIELNGLIGVPGVGDIATSPSDIADLIASKHALMEARYQQIEEDPTSIERLTPHLFIVDEFYVLVMRLNRLQKIEGNKGEHPAIGMFWEMVVLARSARIHIAVGVQRPDAEFLDGFARDSIRHRVSLGPLSEQGSRMMWGTAGVGMDLPGIRGRAVASDPEGRPHEIQVWHLPNPDPRTKDRLTSDQREQLLELLGPAWADTDVLATSAEDAPAPTGPSVTSPSENVDSHAGNQTANQAANQTNDRTDRANGHMPPSTPSTTGRPLVGEKVRADTLVVGDLVRLDGNPVTILSAEFSAAIGEAGDDEDEYVDLEWQGQDDQGVTAVPADEAVERLVGADLVAT